MPLPYRAFTPQPKNLELHSLAGQRGLADVMRLRALQLARRGDFWKQATDLWGSSARYQALNNPHGWHGSLLLRTFWGGVGTDR